MSVTADSPGTPPAKRVTVVIPTRDRAALLPGLLRALMEQTLPKHDFEVIVVDNASTDDTSRVLGDWDPGAMNLTVLTESEIGSSAARNRGIAAATAELVAFIDDDCVPTPSWLATTVACIEADERIGAVVGRFRPPPGFAGPRWLHPAINSFDRGDRARDVNKLQGGNMLVRRVALIAADGFRTDLGIHGDRRGWGEETALARTIRSRGWIIRYCPESLVHHIVKPDKRRLRPLIREAFLRGRQEEDIEGRPIPRRVAARAMLLAMFGRREGDDAPLEARLFIRIYAAARWAGAVRAGSRPDASGPPTSTTEA